MMIKIAVIVLFALQAAAPSPIWAQKLAPLPVEDAINTREFGQFVTPIKFSPDGERLAYVVTDNRKMVASAFATETYARTGVVWSATGADIWILNVKSGQTRNLTQGIGNNWFPAWSPDGRYLAFLSDRDGSSESKLWVWEVASDTLKKISDARVRTGQDLQWLPESRGLLVTILPENIRTEDYVRKSRESASSESEGRTPGAKVRVYKSAPASHDGNVAVKSDPWLLTGPSVDLVVIDVKTGEARPVLRSLDRLGWYLLSPDGTNVALSRPRRFEKPGSQQILWDIDVAFIATGEQRSMVTDVRLAFGGASFSWSPDSSRLAYRASGLLETRGDCYIVDAKGGTPLRVTTFPSGGMVFTQFPPLWDTSGGYVYLIQRGTIWRASTVQTQPAQLADLGPFEVEEIAAGTAGRLWSPDSGRTMIVLSRDHKAKKAAFYRVDLASGRSTKLMEDSQCHTCVNALYHVMGSPSGDAYYFSEDAQHSPDLWSADSDFRAPRRMTHLNPQFDAYQMGAVQLVDWSSDDGDQLRGALLLPAGYERGQRYPLITWVYGGESISDRISRFGLGYDGPFDLQLFATRGYAVFLPDAPQNLGTPMADLAKTVLPGISKVVEIGVADPDRIGVMGHSFGGYSALALLVQSNRFEAAVVSAGYGDLVAHYTEMTVNGTAFGTSIDEGGQGKIGGTPWEFRNRYIENSPIFYLDRIKTPVLMVHGSEDTAVLPYLADEVFVDLRRLGNEVEYAKYDGESHSPSSWSYENQLDVASRWIRWFDKYLKAESSK